MSANNESANEPQQEAQSQKRKLDGNLLMSFAAIFLSAGTLFILIYQSNLISKQFELEREQQLALVMPYLMLEKGNDDGSKYSIYVTNQGLGPAFVEAVRVHYKDTVIEHSDLFKAYPYLQKADTNISLAQYYSTIAAGRLIASQETIEHLHLTRQKDMEYDLLTNGDAQLEIEYRSIYNQRWRVTGTDGIPERIE